MANEIFTRIQLKHDSYANWDAVKDTFKPLPGEICIVEVPTGNAAATTAPTVLFKVGAYKKDASGNNTTELHTFAELPWASALAADVYAWAKESSLYIHKDGTGNVVSGVEWDATLNDGKGGLKYTTASVATSEELETLQKEVYGEDGTAGNSRIDKIEKDIADNRDSWALNTDTQYFFSTDGDKLVVKKALFTNGTKGTEEDVGSYEFLTTDEARAIADGLIGKADITIIAGIGLSNGGSFNVNATEAKTITISHAATSSIENVAKTDRTYISGISFDPFGHVLSVETGTETVVDTNTAHIHSAGDGLKITGVNGGIDGDTKYELNLKFVDDSDNKTLKLVDAADETKVIASFETTDFIADGMLQSVVANEEKNELVFTWNTDGGDTVTTIPFDKIADIYTGKATDEITVAVSNTNEITATLNNGKVTEAKLEKDVRDALALARTALQEHQDISGKADKVTGATDGNFAGLDANGNLIDSGKKADDFKTKQTPVDSKNLTGAKVLGSLSQNANGEITYETRDLTLEHIGAAAANNVVNSIITNGGLGSDGNGAVYVTTGNDGLYEKGNVTLSATLYDGVIAKKHLGTALTTEIEGKANDADLHAIAKSGSIYDVKEGSVANTGSDKATNPKYLVFNCGSATTVI